MAVVEGGRELRKRVRKHKMLGKGPSGKAVALNL